MHLEMLRLVFLGLSIVYASALDFSQSSWIWTNENFNGSAPVGSRAFRNDWCSPSPLKTPSTATIFLTADNAFTLYLNGAVVGSANDWTTPLSFCVSLAPGCNTFAVNATNTSPSGPTNPAGFLAAIQIVFTDGTTSLLVSDSTWLYSLTFPAGWQDPGFNDDQWPFANEVAPYGSSPWGTLNLPLQPSVITLPSANWIWTNEVNITNNTISQVPIGSRAFRKDITLPSGQTATAALVTISADDQYSIYVQGQLIGSGTQWQVAQVYVAEFASSASKVVIAVNATNVVLQAGLIITVALAVNDVCGPFTSIVTDSSWKTSISFPANWQSPTFDDSSWPSAVIEGPWGIQPWGNVPTL